MLSKLSRVLKDKSSFKMMLDFLRSEKDHVLQFLVYGDDGVLSQSMKNYLAGIYSLNHRLNGPSQPRPPTHVENDDGCIKKMIEPLSTGENGTWPLLFFLWPGLFPHLLSIEK